MNCRNERPDVLQLVRDVRIIISAFNCAITNLRIAGVDLVEDEFFHLGAFRENPINPFHHFVRRGQYAESLKIDNNVTQLSKHVSIEEVVKSIVPDGHEGSILSHGH